MITRLQVWSSVSSFRIARCRGTSFASSWCSRRSVLTCTLRRYERYWQGRTSWSDVMRTTRTMGRLVWYHVPLRMGPAGKKEDSGKSAAPNGKEKEVDAEKAREIRRLMLEKKMALDLIEGYAILYPRPFSELTPCVYVCRFAVALKHHLRGLSCGLITPNRPLKRSEQPQERWGSITRTCIRLFGRCIA